MSRVRLVGPNDLITPTDNFVFCYQRSSYRNDISPSVLLALENYLTYSCIIRSTLSTRRVLKISTLSYSEK